MQQRMENKNNNDNTRIASYKDRLKASTTDQMTITWMIMIGVMLFHQLPTAYAAYNDPCETKSQPGTCKEWSECPVIKTLIERGEYTNREVVSCGFGIREEMICCPVIKTDTKIEVTTSETPSETSTVGKPRDFWLDVLDELKSTTSTTTTTTTTTVKPLVIGNQRLDESSEFFDFSQLLTGNRGNQRRQTNSPGIVPNNQPIVENSQPRGNNANGNLNTGPLNTNQWNFNSPGSPNNRITNGRGNSNFQNERGPPGLSRGNSLNNNFQNNGRGNAGRGQSFNNGRGVGRGPNNQNREFVQSNNNNGVNNNFNEFAVNVPDQSWSASNVATNPEANEHNRVNQIINSVFETPQNSQHNTAIRPNMDQVISDIFFSEHPEANVNNANPTILWPQNPDIPVYEVEIIDPNRPTFVATHEQLVQPIQFEQNHMEVNDLETAPSSHIAAAAAQNWNGHVAPAEAFDPVQSVYENLLNSGMQIVRAKGEMLGQFTQQPAETHSMQQFGRQLNRQPQQFVQQTQFGAQPTHDSQTGLQFGQQPLVGNRQPSQSLQFGQQPQVGVQQSTHHLQPSQSESNPRQLRIPSHLVQVPANGPQFPNVQSPPAHILDPFKPFEFRPPPADEVPFTQDDNSIRSNPGPVTTRTPTDRPAVRACQRILRGLIPGLTQHILGGTPAELGEFPHMVAIGYSRLGDDGQGPYDIRCGGTLIDSRFVLTAAHCVSARDSVPAIVRLGVVNFNDPNAMHDAVELRIKETFIHDDYSTRRTYNDIAILELEQPVNMSQYIYPVCLYTDEADPKPEVRLWVTGWGTVNTSTRAYSDILLKAPLHVTPLERCNNSFVDYGLTRQIDQGIIKTQLCAEDKDQIRDACQGDSGGPLNLVVDESYKNYRLVGVVSSGFGCASSTPGLYTRVAAFLDFIERIVWPNGGD